MRPHDDDFSQLDRVCVIDVETTGLDTLRDCLVSIAAIQTDFRKMGRHTRYLDGKTLMGEYNPECEIPAEARAIHGISSKDAKGYPKFKEYAKQFREWIGTRMVIAHNAEFDVGILNAELKRAKVEQIPWRQVVCTMMRWRLTLITEDGCGSSLAACADMLGIPGRKGKQHTAEEDALMCMGVAGALYRVDKGWPPMIDPDDPRETGKSWLWRMGRKLWPKTGPVMPQRLLRKSMFIFDYKDYPPGTWELGERYYPAGFDLYAYASGSGYLAELEEDDEIGGETAELRRRMREVYPGAGTGERAAMRRGMRKMQLLEAAGFDLMEAA